MFFSVGSLMSVCVVVGIMVLLLQRRQFLMVLLVLEGLALLFLGVILFSFFSDLYIVFITLTMAACEASLGLSLLVMMIRYFGNDSLSNLVINKW